ncbi:MAG: type I methionyl aminopeptidase [Anaerolineae bacterium]|nr:type I methionyl aminopeptidase [Anaerolineae bacterium]
MGIPLKSQRALARMRAAGRIVAETFALLSEHIAPGITLAELDRLAEKYLKSQHTAPLYKGYRGNPPEHPPFPGVICASVNHEICHGLPNERILQAGDIVGIDIGLRYQGYCGDACMTFGVGQISAEAQRLLDVSRECLHIGIEAAQLGHHLNDIGRAIEAYAQRQRVSVVREWGGHGLGKSLHESPSVSHVREAKRGPQLRPGMVFTIEPMINLGTHEWVQLDDGWTVVTADSSLSAQFEHTVAITKNGVEILSKL